MILTIAQHFIRLTNLVELLQMNFHFIWILHGMVLQGELLEVGLDLLLRSYPLDLENVVIVLLRWKVCHFFKMRL